MYLVRCAAWPCSHCWNVCCRVDRSRGTDPTSACCGAWSSCGRSAANTHKIYIKVSHCWTVCCRADRSRGTDPASACCGAWSSCGHSAANTQYIKVSYIAEPLAAERTDPVVQIQLLHVVVLGPHVGAQLPTRTKYKKVSHCWNVCCRADRRSRGTDPASACCGAWSSCGHSAANTQNI